MSKLAFVAISALSELDPVLAHLSFVFSLINFSILLSYNSLGLIKLSNLLIHELKLSIGGLRNYSMIGIIYEHSLLILLETSYFIHILHVELSFVHL